MSTARGYVALFAGLFAVSTSGPFLKMAQVDAFSAVFWRTALAGLLALTIARMRGVLDGAALLRHGRGLTLGGLLLGGHFLLWVKAFDLTDFASNLLLLTAQPVFATMLSRYLGEAMPRLAWLAMALTLSGMMLIAGADISLGARALLGDLLCIVAGVLITLFYVLAREARAALPLDVFTGATMLVAALVALPVALLAEAPLFRYGAESWGWLLAIVVVTTLGGHGLTNLAARHVSMFELNLVIVLEPMIAIAMGALLFGASVTGLQCVGGALLMGAVIAGMLREPTARAVQGAA